MLNVTYYYPRKTWEVIIRNANDKKSYILKWLLNRINIVLLNRPGLLILFLILYSSFNISVQLIFIIRHRKMSNGFLVSLSVPYFLGEVFLDLVYFQYFKIYCGSQKYFLEILIKNLILNLYLIYCKHSVGNSDNFCFPKASFCIIVLYRILSRSHD